MRHSWVDHFGISRCTNCHIEVPTWKAKKGGLPPCVADYTPTHIHTHAKAPCLISTNVKPVVSCFNCPARIVDTQCEKLRVESGYKPSGRKVNLD